MKSPTRINLPFKMIPKEGIGAGELVKRITKAVGIKPCDGCEERAKRWDKRLVIGRR